VLARDTTVSSTDAFRVTRLRIEELDAVLAIDAESFLRPWTRRMYEASLGNAEVTRIFLLRLADGAAVGYCSTWFLPGELHINNLAILPAYRRQGLATGLMQAVLAAAAAAGCDRATLEVRRSNLAARRLYERLGFTTAGLRPDYYSEPVEDALILWRGGPEAVPPDKSVEGPDPL
jgi:ribosomal-protein-alanine N-acetyltransferase